MKHHMELILDKFAPLGLMLSFSIHCSSTPSESIRSIEEQNPYLSLSSIRLYSTPSVESPILGDIEKHRLVYAVPTKNANWVEIREVSATYYPISHNNSGSSSKIPSLNGKLVFDSTNNESVKSYKIKGYAEVNFLGNLRKPEPLPFAPQNIKPVPSVLKEINVEEKRFVPLDPTQPPFSSIVALSIRGDGQQREQRIFCTGFFIESQTTIGTAGHCLDHKKMSAVINNPRSGGLDIGVLKKDGSFEWIPARLSAIRNHTNDKIGDWAVLTIERPPSSPVQPLRLPTNGDWLKHGSMQVMTLGYGADIRHVVSKTFGGIRFHGDICEMPLSAAKLIYTQYSKTGLPLAPSSMQVGLVDGQCISTNGDSGGPLIYWNSTKAQYEVIGINSHSDYRSFVSIKENLTEDAKSIYEKHMAKVKLDYESSESDTYPYPPGAAVLIHLITKQRAGLKANQFWDLSSEFIAAVTLATIGKTIDPTEAFQSLTNGISGIGDVSDDNRIDLHLEPLYQLHDYKYLHRARRNFVRFKEVATLFDEKNQQKTTIGDVFDIELLVHNGIPHQVLYFLSFGGDIKLVLPDDFQKVNDELLSALDKADSNRKHIIKELISKFQNLRLILVGGDLYLIEAKTGRVKEVVRNWMIRYNGDLAVIRNHIFYNKSAESPLKNESDLSSSGAAIDITAPVVEPESAWQSIIAGLKKKNSTVFVLAAMSSETKVPTAIDLSFANRWKDVDTENLKELDLKMKLHGITKGSPIITYCYHSQCEYSIKLAKILIQLGYKKVQWMRSGINGWIDAGLPVELANNIGNSR